VTADRVGVDVPARARVRSHVMADVQSQPLEISPERSAVMFPPLSAAHIARIESHGSRRRVDDGEVLVNAGDQVAPFFVVKSGGLEIVRPSTLADTMVRTLGPGAFTGETGMLVGRRSLVRVRANAPSELVELTRPQLLSLVQTDTEISEILMRAFIYRRLELIAHGIGDAVLIGSVHSADTLRIKEFLTRNGHPFAYVDLDHDADVQALLDRFHVAADQIPVLICRGDVVLRNPSNRKIADCLGFNDSIDRTHVRDIVVVGGGPAGLAAAVYGASEGLDVLIVEADAPGGQAGQSSNIENYLGFPTGVSGLDLAGRAATQAVKFGAQIMVAKSARGLTCARKPYAVQIDDDARVAARTVIIATGAQYRRPAVENLSRFENAGVYYGATFMEAQLCVGDEVMVVGGANSAGQAAVFLSKTASRVHMLVRSSGLAETMSRYLIRRIDESKTIELRTSAEIVGLDGDTHLEYVRIRDNRTGEIETSPMRHVFFMTGAVPNTAWLRGCVAVDAKGFVKTGPMLTQDELLVARWPLARAPHLLETSLPGVFAVGDVRGGSVKRVASAVGEGSIAISFVHQVLAES
jgi:thioredoxin reductase (NADPH)